MQLQQDRGRLPSEQKKLEEEALHSIQHQARPWINEIQYPVQEESSSPPKIGTVDIERTCSITPPKTKYDVVVKHKHPTTPHILLLLDVSTSITPQQKNFILVLTFALIQNPIALTISIFSTTSTTIYTPGENPTHREIFDRIQKTIKPGYTHLHEGMKELERQYKKSPFAQKMAVIVSDGMSNYGARPHHKDFFLPNLLFLCFSKKSDVFGFSPSVIRTIQSTNPLPKAFQLLQDVIMEHQI